jgi:hypothetical protein
MQPERYGRKRAADELSEFVAEKELGTYADADPMDYRFGKMAVWHHLAPRALAALSRSLTSVDTERYFSTLNWIVGLRRTRLLTGNLASLASIKREMQTAADVALGEGVVNWDGRRRSARSEMVPRDNTPLPRGCPLNYDGIDFDKGEGAAAVFAPDVQPRKPYNEA